MKFYFHLTNKVLERPFGDEIRGLRVNDKRPLNCYISPYELEDYAQSNNNLAAHLHQLQLTLDAGGRIVIKDL